MIERVEGPIWKVDRVQVIKNQRRLKGCRAKCPITGMGIDEGIV